MSTELGRWTSEVAGHYSRPGLVVWASKPSVAGFAGLGLKTRAEVLMPEGRHMAASGSSRRSEATGEKARWPSISIYPESDHIALGDVVKLIMYLGVVRGFGQKRGCDYILRAAPPLLSASHFSVSSVNSRHCVSAVFVGSAPLRVRMPAGFFDPSL